MKTALEVKNLTKVYKIYKNNTQRLLEAITNRNLHIKHYANKNISFELYQGETLGIIGLNGAGKSTLLKMLANVVEPTSGEIIINGKLSALLELGTGFNVQMNGIDNIYLNGMLLGMQRQEIDSKLDEIISFSELKNYIKSPLSTYSSGMLMRLAFSIALFSESNILLVDEALSVGDAHFSQKCTQALKERKKHNLSIIYVSHDLNSLKILCDRVILLNSGEIVSQGNAESVMRAYNYLISNLDANLCLQEEKENYGNEKASIIDVKMLQFGSETNIFTSGDNFTISVLFKANESLEDLSVGIMIRDKLGLDIFGTNTALLEKDINIRKDEVKKVYFSGKLNIGSGFYTLTVALHQNESHVDECYAWADNIKEFEILADAKFVGICKLNMDIKVENV